MARRLIGGGHEVGAYNRTPEKLKPLIDHGAKAMASIKAAANFGEAVFTMLADDAAVLDVVQQAAPLRRLAKVLRSPANTASRRTYFIGFWPFSRAQRP